MVSDRLLEIKQSVQSIWIDNLSRDLIQSGELQNLLDNYGVSGVTSNPAIFEKAIIGNALCDRDIEAGIRASLPTIKIYESLIFQDVRDACDILYPVYQQTDKLDGYVSIEVPPTIAHDTQATVTETLRYFREIGRKNVMVKIPGTPSGLPAVTEAIAQGVNVNITLLFSLESYLNSYQAYIQGLSKRASANHDLGQIASVASFFLSRNAQVQRLLWASTSTIEDAYNLIESLKEPDININLNAVIAEVLREGIEKFVQPFQSLMNSLEGKVRLMSTV